MKENKTAPDKRLEEENRPGVMSDDPRIMKPVCKVFGRGYKNEG
jgi:hypothetical protein